MSAIKHIETECITTQSPFLQSRAAYVLLRRRLKQLDHTERWENNKDFRKNLLKERQDANGELFCEYCGKGPLLVEAKGILFKTMLATLDHIIPLCRGGGQFDKGNIKVSCPQCNVSKEDKRLVEFVKQIDG